MTTPKLVAVFSFAGPIFSPAMRKSVLLETEDPTLPPLRSINSLISSLENVPKVPETTNTFPLRTADACSFLMVSKESPISFKRSIKAKLAESWK
jgi:hypothetical protein